MTEDWEVRPLGELVDVLDSQRIPVSATERATRPGVVPYYGATGQVGWIDEALFDEPLILLGEDGVQFFDPTKSKAYLIDGPTWVNNHAHVLRAREVDRRYLNHFLNQVDYRAFANGTTRLKLTQAAMRRIPVLCPCLSEQRRIVEILENQLSRLEAAGASLRSARARMNLLRERMFNAVLDKVPVKNVQFDRTLIQGLANGRSVQTLAGGFPVLRLTALRDGRIDLAERKEGAWNRADAERFLVEKGDFLIARGNGSLRLVGIGGLVVDDPDPVAYPDTLMRARPDPTQLSPEFLALVWNSQVVRRQIEASARTTAGIYKVNQKDLGSVLVPLPSLSDQTDVVARVQGLREGVSRLAAAEDLATRRLESLRRSLLAAAFSGRLTSVAGREPLEIP